MLHGHQFAWACLPLGGLWMARWMARGVASAGCSQHQHHQLPRSPGPQVVFQNAGSPKLTSIFLPTSKKLPSPTFTQPFPPLAMLKILSVGAMVATALAVPAATRPEKHCTGACKNGDDKSLVRPARELARARRFRAGAFAGLFLLFAATAGLHCARPAEVGSQPRACACSPRQQLLKLCARGSCRCASST